MIRRYVGILPSWRRVSGVLGIASFAGGYALSLHSSGAVFFLLIACGLLLGLSLLGIPLATFAAGTLTAAYLMALLRAGVTVDAGAPLVGVALYLLIELLQPDGTTPDLVAPGAARGRVFSVAAIAIGGSVLASLTLVLGSVVRVSGPLSVAAGGLVAVILLGTVLWYQRSLLASDHRSRQDR